MKLRKRLLFLFSLLVSAFLIIASAGCTNTSESKQTASDVKKPGYPNKEIELVVAYAAGGGTDAIARLVANAAAKYMPNEKTIVVSNKVGGSGTLALSELMQASPDGYKIGSVTTTNLAIQPHYGNTPFESDSFTPIVQFSAIPNVLVVKKDSQWKTYDDWVNWVKKNPGQFSYGTAALGGTQHLAMEGINLLEGIQTKHVPFDGAAPALTALLGNHVQGAIVNANEAKPHVDSDAMRVLANAGTKKLNSDQNTVFLKDKGFIGMDSWSGIVVPKETPQEIVDTLQEVFEKAMNDPSVKEEFKKMGIEPAYANQEEFVKTIHETNEIAGELLKKAGLVK